MSAARTRHLQPSDLQGLRWRAYLRESTAAQADRGTPLDRQRADIERAATELGLVPSEPTFYTRTGSGEAERAPELLEALAGAERHEYDVLLVFHSSRLGRNRVEVGLRKRDFAKAGAILYFVAQHMISGAFQSALAEGVGEVIDQYDGEVRRMWIAGGLRERQKAGKWVGNIPFGYRPVMADFPDGSRRWDGALETDPAEYPVFRRVVEEWIAGRSGREIALSLNAQGLTRPRAGAWFQTTVERMMKNPVYLGELHRYRIARADHYYEATDAGDGRLTVEGRWPALVTPEEHAALCQPRKGLRNRRHPAFTYPLASVLRCGLCGRSYTGTSNGETRYYRCNGRVMGTGCPAPHVRSGPLEESFAKWLDRLTLPADWRDRIARSQLNGPKTDEAARRQRTETRLARLRELYLWGDLTEDAYRAQSAELRTELAVVAMPNVASMETVADLLADVGKTWRQAPASARGLLPRALLANGTLNGQAVEWNARAELRVLLDLCVLTAPCPYPDSEEYTLSYAV